MIYFAETDKLAVPITFGDSVREDLTYTRIVPY